MSLGKPEILLNADANDGEDRPYGKTHRECDRR
jgi:hypothetical protein